MNRRHFLKLAGAGAVTVTVGATGLRLSHWWDQVPAEELSVLSQEEASIAAAIVDALFPGDQGRPPLPNGVDVGVVAGFDGYLANIDEKSRQGLRLLLHAIDDMAVFSDLGLTRFHKRDRSDRIEVLDAWDNSGLMARRQGFRALKYTLSNQYCNQPAVLDAMGVTFSCGGAG